MVDYHVTMTIKNGRIKKLMDGLGIKSAAELSRQSGICSASICALLNMKAKPMNSNGKWNPVVIALSEFFGVACGEMFPELAFKTVSSNKIYKYVEQAQLASLNTDPPQIAWEKEYGKHEAVRALLAAQDFTPKEKLVIKERIMCGKTLLECAKLIRVTPSRVRQIEARVLRRLRHPYWSKVFDLKNMYEED